MVKIDRYGFDFVVANVHIDLLPNKLAIGPDRVLSYGNNVSVEEFVCPINGKVWALGFPILSSEDGVPRDIPKKLKVDVRIASFDWAGRWLLITKTQIVPDACANLDCYFKRQFGEVIAASDPALLGEKPVAEDKQGLKTGYIIPPGSGWRDVERLLPTQILDHVEVKIVRRPLPEISFEGSYVSKINKINKINMSILRGLQKKRKNLWLPLTGGYDSRLLLSTCVAAKLKIKTFTFQKPSPNMPYADKIYPPKLAKIAGVPHLKIEEIKNFKANTTLIDERFPYATNPPGSPYFYFERGHYDQIPNETYILCGLFGEFGRYYFEKDFPDENISAEALAATGSLSQPNKKAAEKLLEWWSEYPIDKFDLVERAHWEARLSGWAASSYKLNEFILSSRGIEYVPAFNCLRKFFHVLSIERSQRVGGKYMKDIMSLNNKQLVNVGMNISGNIFHRISRRIEKAANKLTK